MVIGVYHEEIVFNIIKIAIYNVILGIFWLRRYNLTIQWQTGKLDFFKYKYNIVIFVFRGGTDKSVTKVKEILRR